MKRIISFILCSLLIVGGLTGCGGKGAEDTSKNNPTAAAVTGTEQAEDTQAPAEPVELKIWHDADEATMAVIAQRVNDTLKADGIIVTFEKKSGLTDQLKLYGTDAANGPDMFFYAQDSVGIFAEMGILAPITDIISEEDMADLLPMTLEAGTYKEVKYQLPVYFETLLFLYNKDLWKGEVPSTTDELYNYMLANTDTAAGTYAVINQHSTAYNVAPFINGFGGYIINSDAEPGLNLQATKDAIAYNQKFAKLQADGDYNTVTTLFNDKKAAAIIGGPWLISGIKEAGINLGFKSLADFKLPNGNGLAPYSGVQGFEVMKYAAESKKEAIAKVLQVLAGAEVGIDLAKQSNCAPANAKAYDDADVSANEMIMAMKATAETAQPMPNIPQLSVMWAPTESLLAAVNKSGEDIDASADKYQQDALTAISDMQ
jgi:maltose-binding protein MalE